MRSYSYNLNSLIPGGAHTYSRGDDQFPENAPQILSHGKGCYVWDSEGNKYLDYGMALRAVTVGYAHESIAKAAIDEILKGNNLTRASLTELKSAEIMTELIPCAEMVKFAKNGSTVTTAAVKLARAHTGRKYIAFCKDHPFFSYDDWFIGTTQVSRGVPEEYSTLSLSFRYNDIKSLERLFETYPHKIAAVILEPVTTVKPENGFLQAIRKKCTENGTLLILDEMITGFRWHIQGAQKYFDVKPDLATFGKGMANGFSVAALVGSREVMELGGILKQGEERVFLISTTHGAEMSSLGAFGATVEAYRELNIIEHIWTYGKKLMDGMNDVSKQLGINDFFYVEGFPCSPSYVTKDREKNPSLEFRTFFAQEMIRNGVLMPYIALSYSHGRKELDLTLESLRNTLKVYSMCLEEGLSKYLIGKPIKPVFRKFN
ncbi:MAG: glutamate-1-semialdehyde 2,1-aminomutase [Vulcanimicrobiota bacterium]